MARFEHTEIYKAAANMSKFIDQMVVKFPQRVKYLLGSRLLDLSLKVVSNIIEANSERNKVPFIEAILGITRDLSGLLAHGREMGYISTKNYATVSEMLVNVIKQAKGWLKYSYTSATKQGTA